MFDAPEGPGGGLVLTEKVTPGDYPLVHIEVADVEAELRKAESLGAKVTKEKTEIPTIGWYGIFEDDDGNKFGIYESLPRD